MKHNNYNLSSNESDYQVALLEKKKKRTSFNLVWSVTVKLINVNKLKMEIKYGKLIRKKVGREQIHQIRKPFPLRQV